MAQEIELKLALTHSGLGRTAILERLADIAELAGTTPRRRWLANTYFDTPEHALERAKMALRLRRSGEDADSPGPLRQTLKTSGESHGGLHSRGEWEWALPDGQTGLDLGGLRGLPPLQALEEGAREHLLGALAPTFSTDFERHAWQLELTVTQDGQTAGVGVEMALDLGHVKAAGRETHIREIELELTGGDDLSAEQREGVLWALAESLASRLALRPADASKARRGAALRDGEWHEKTLDTTDTNALLAAAIDALDAHADRQQQDDMRWHDHALAAFSALASRLAASQHPGHVHAVALTEALSESREQGTSDSWMTAAFGQHSLSLLAALRSRGQ
ncbi:CYTH domain-containing protein [Cobetia marina]|uniref:CYTH domain-containing protein n=1 Tax=Cobetia marina TaxID=28258 RepID=UPI0038573C7A